MVVAIKKEDRVVVGLCVTDCLIDMTAKDLSLEENIPFWKVKGEKDCYVCLEDTTLSSDLLRYNDNVFKGVTDGKSIIEKVIPKMKELFYKHSCLIDGKEWNNQMLIIKGNRVFRVSNYFCVSEETDHVALGYERYFQGALDGIECEDPTETILTAVNSVSRLNNKLFFPLTIIDIKSKKRQVFYK